MKKTLKKIVVLIVIYVLLIQTLVPASYAENVDASIGEGWLPEEQQRAVADYAQKFVKEGNEKKLLLFSQNRYDRIKGYNFEVTSNEYGQYDGKQNNGAPFTNMLVYDSASFIATIYNRTLWMNLSANENARDNVYTVASFMSDAGYAHALEYHGPVIGKNFGLVYGERTYKAQELIDLADRGGLIPGDLIAYKSKDFSANETSHIVMYLGTNADIKYESLKMTEMQVELLKEGINITTGQKVTIPLSNPHYFVHAANSEKNIEVSALESLLYQQANGLSYNPTSVPEYIILRPMATASNRITEDHKVDMDILWPDNTYSAYTKVGIDPVTGDTYEYYYMGIANAGVYSYNREETGVFKWLINLIGEIVSWISGFIGLLLRSQLVGWTSVVEGIASDVIQSAGKVQRQTVQTVNGNQFEEITTDTINVEDIVYNKVPLFDSNIFSFNTIAGISLRPRMDEKELEQLKADARSGNMVAREELRKYYNSILVTMPEKELTELEEEAIKGDADASAALDAYRKQENVIITIRKNVAYIYYAIRNIAIVGLLITLIYIGIRMALTSIAEQKAKYKQILVNWAVSLCIVFMIHYVMIFTMKINEELIKLLPKINGGVKFYDAFKELAFGEKFVEGWIGAIIYMVLVYYMIKYAWIYFKRFFTLCILTIYAPIIGIGYAVDKIKNNRSKSLSRWLKNYVFNVLIQFVHAALYTVLMSIAYTLMVKDKNIVNIVPAALFTIIFLNFISKAPKIVSQIFGMESSAQTLKSTLTDFGSQVAVVTSVFGLLGTQAKLYGRAGRAVKGKFLNPISDAIRYGSVKNMSYSRNYKDIEDEEERLAKIKADREMDERLQVEFNQKIKEDRARRKAYTDAQIEYAKSMGGMVKSAILGATALPTAVISPAAGTALFLKSKNLYSKTKEDLEERQSKILGYDVDRFEGKFTRLAMGVTGGYALAGAVMGTKTQLDADSKQAKITQIRTSIINEEAKFQNEIIKQLDEIAAEKHKLVEEGKEDEAKVKLAMELETIRAAVLKSANGKGNVDGKIENGKIVISIPEEIIRIAIEKYKEDRIRKQLVVSFGGRHRKELLEFIQEYANVNISQQIKLEDVELVLQAEVFKDVINKMTCSSYREGEEDRDNRYRDPRKASSLLEEKNISEQAVDKGIERHVDIRNVEQIGRDDVSTMAERILNESSKDTMETEERRAILGAIEGKIEEKVAKLQTQQLIANITENEYMKEKQREINIEIGKEKEKEIEEAIDGLLKEHTENAERLLKEKLDVILPESEMQKLMDGLDAESVIKTISGKTEIEVPSRLTNLVESSRRLSDLHKELRILEPKEVGANIDTLLNMIGRESKI